MSETLFGRYPVISITVPRQSGKTTLIKHLFSDMPYVSLEDHDERQFAIQDPPRFFDRFSDGAILDGVQRTPRFFPIYRQSFKREKTGFTLC